MDKKRQLAVECVAKLAGGDSEEAMKQWLQTQLDNSSRCAHECLAKKTPFRSHSNRTAIKTDLVVRDELLSIAILGQCHTAVLVPFSVSVTQLCWLDVDHATEETLVETFI